MSLRNRILLIALAAALMFLAGGNLTTMQRMVGAVASAVWGS